MRGFSLPEQEWIMIIPVTRKADGSVSVWNRNDSWNRDWTVPKATPAGTRTVAVNGDSEDMRIVSPFQIDNMSIDSLSKLASKYGTAAIAVVVSEEGTDNVAVAAWAKGNYATWDSVAPSGRTRREAALAMLDDIYSGSSTSVAVPGAESATGAVSIVAQRYNQTFGTNEYRIVGERSDLERLANDPAISVTSRNEDVPSSIDLWVNDGRDIEQIIRGVGLSSR